VTKIFGFFFVKCSNYSPIDLFSNITKNLQPGSHFGHLNKDVFSTTKMVQYMRINFATDQFNRTRLIARWKEQARWKEFITTWQNIISKVVNGGQAQAGGGDHGRKK